MAIFDLTTGSKSPIDDRAGCMILRTVPKYSMLCATT